MERGGAPSVVQKLVRARAKKMTSLTLSGALQLNRPMDRGLKAELLNETPDTRADHEVPRHTGGTWQVHGRLMLSDDRSQLDTERHRVMIEVRRRFFSLGLFCPGALESVSMSAARCCAYERN